MFSFLHRLRNRDANKHHHNRIILSILISAAVIFLSLASYFSYYFFLSQKEAQHEAYLAAKQQALVAAAKIDQNFFNVMSIANSIARDLDTNTLKPEDLGIRLKKAVTENRMIIGIGAAFNPYGHYPNKLYAPYYFRDHNNAWQLIDITKSYDYTKPKISPQDPNTDWFLLPTKKNSFSWIQPFYATITKDLVSLYGIPFYYPNKGQSSEAQRGVVMLTMSLSDIDLMMAQLNLGQTGYAIVTSDQGIVISHPEKNEISKKLKLNSLPSNSSELSAYKNPISGQTYWTFSFNLKSTGWKLIIMLNTADFVIKPIDKIRNISFVITFGLLGLIALLGAIVRVDRGNVKRLWFFAISSSMLCFIAMILVWITTVQVIEPISGTKIVEQEQLNRFLISERIIDHNVNKLLIPTGVLINNINFTTQETAAVSGFVWQRIPLDNKNDVYGFLFPQAIGFTNIALVSQKIIGNEKLMLWSFFTSLKEEYNPNKYPLDKENFTIQLLPHDVADNVFLIPDLQNYHSLNPALLPGVKNNINLKIWKVDTSFYSYETNTAEKNIRFLSSTKPLHLQFNISMHRSIVNSLINNLIPLLLVALMLYAVLLTNIITTIIPISGAMLFFIALGHFSMRSYIVMEGMSYLDYLYVFMYVFITLVVISCIVSAKEIWPVKVYKENFITRILYWPVFSASCFLITISIFGYLFK